MPDNSDRDPADRDPADQDPSDSGAEDELRDMLRDFLSGNSEIDPNKLASAAGLPNDPALVAQLMGKLQEALQSSGDGINWDLATEQAKAVAGRDRQPSLPAERSALEQAFHIAALWLDEATFISELSVSPRLISRTEWVTATMPIWTQMAEPVASSIADALTRVLHEQSPEDMSDMIAGASRLMRNVGGTLFAMQLGQVVGQLSTEVVSGGDVGIPLLGAEDDSSEQAAIIPQNVAAFGAGLDIELDQIRLYLAVRELSHARLFRHARWLRLQLLTSITETSRGITVNTERLEELAESFDPSNPESLQRAVSAGELLAPKNESQLAALARLETTLALIEGWVDVVTAEATKVLSAVLPGVELTDYDLGAARYHRTGEVLPASVQAELAGHDGILLGAVGDPAVPPGILERGLLLKLRFAFDHYVNLRPSRLWPGTASPLANVKPGEIDMLVIREGTEGLYAGAGGLLHKDTPAEIATEESLNTRYGVERVIRDAFRRAMARERRKVTMVHKSNVLTYAGDLWTRTFAQVAADFPDVKTEYQHVDAAAMFLVSDPQRYDVVVTDNLFGDILTDVAAAVTGGIGLAASGNINPDRTAPSYE